MSRETSHLVAAQRRPFDGRADTFGSSAVRLGQAHCDGCTAVAVRLAWVQQIAIVGMMIHLRRTTSIDEHRARRASTSIAHDEHRRASRTTSIDEHRARRASTSIAHDEHRRASRTTSIDEHRARRASTSIAHDEHRRASRTTSIDEHRRASRTAGIDDNCARRVHGSSRRAVPPAHVLR
ncbi:MAG: hypothetical protein QM784_27505 [Polyangiaceae bacterium]